MNQFQFGDKAALCRITGMAPQTVSRWLRTRSMPIRIALIAQFEFGVDALSLMSPDDAKLVKRLLESQPCQS